MRGPSCWWPAGYRSRRMTSDLSLKKYFICMESFLHFLPIECFFFFVSMVVVVCYRFWALVRQTRRWLCVRDLHLYIWIQESCFTNLRKRNEKNRPPQKKKPTWHKQCTSLCFTPGDLCIKTLFVLKLTQLWPLKRKYWTPIHPPSLFLCLPCPFFLSICSFSLCFFFLWEGS